MLRAHGFHAVTMRRLAAAWAGRATLPRRPIVLTFDDGYRSDATVALPVLRRAGWRAVLYLEAGALKTRGAQGVSRRAVREVLRNGWELGSHTIDHLDVSTLGPRRLRYEIGYSRRWLERTFGVRIESFCYPGGRFDHAAVREVERAGYATATTVKEGLATRRRRYTLRRIRVDAHDTAATLRRKLARAR
jgi:peptidoglycan/xylan/chitin deacetylase (PgdA/CDA1 family)